MIEADTFSCFLIGTGSLMTRCAELLLSRKHRILGLLSSDPAIQAWARTHSIPHQFSDDDLLSRLNQQPFDYLFSINNQQVLSPAILETPCRWAINYHDSLLPRYAGVNATSWALMHQETVHGITWHVIRGRVDAGEILKQRVVPIAPGETAFTLNTRCYEAAFDAFAELIEDLARGRAEAVPQDPAQRAYFPLYRRPERGGVVSWQQSAEQLDALVRALDFGPYENPLGRAKLAVGDEFFLFSILELRANTSGAPPGTVIGIEADALRMATATREVVLRELHTMEGQPLSAADMASRLNLCEGSRLPELDAEQAARLTERNSALSRYERFWRERLAGLRPCSLPSANWRQSAGEPVRASMVDMPIPGSVRALLADSSLLDRQSDFLLAAFASYLARLTEATGVDLGFRDSGLRRDLAGLERFFAAVVPLQVELDEEASFPQLYRTVCEQVERTRCCGSYARDLVVRSPALHAMPELRREHPWAVSIEIVPTLADSWGLSAQALTLIIPEAGRECRWVYSPDKLDSEAVARMQCQFTTFLEGIVADPDGRFDTLPLLTAGERHQLLVAWNDTAMPYPREACIHELFEAQAARTPDATAVTWEEKALTYRELNEQANQLAHYLRQRGIGPEVLVGLHVERSLEMVIGLLGILKSGGAYLPLDPAFPSERLTFMMEDAGIPLLVTQERFRAVGPAGVERVCLDSDREAISRSSAENPDSPVDPDDLVYAIYTSGSTGRPKGILIQHRGLTNLIQSAVQQFGIRPDSRVLQYVSLSFDVFTRDVFMPLVTGASLHIASRETLLSTQELSAFLRDHAITVADLPPTILALLQPEDFPALQTITTGGERITRRLAATWAAGRSFFNVYGPAEATIHALAEKCGDKELRDPPIGRPIANTRVYVLDRYGHPAPVGATGELYLGGPGLARGYLGLPALTADRFTPDPFGDEPGARLYRTGDRVRYLPDGRLEFVGRQDHQTKIRGFRIELEEIDAVLEQHPHIERAVTVLCEEGEEKRLLAFCVPRDDGQPKASELRHFLQQRLPGPMLPFAFPFVRTVPLTPSGKADRRALAASPRLELEREHPYVPPRTPMEQQLARIWSQVLRVERVGIHDNFLAVGGHSLAATQIVSHISDAFGVRLPIRTLFEQPTIAGLVVALLQQAEPSAIAQLLEEIESLCDEEPGQHTGRQR